MAPVVVAAVAMAAVDRVLAGVATRNRAQAAVPRVVGVAGAEMVGAVGAAVVMATGTVIPSPARQQTGNRTPCAEVATRPRVLARRANPTRCVPMWT